MPSTGLYAGMLGKLALLMWKELTAAAHSKCLPSSKAPYLIQDYCKLLQHVYVHLWHFLLCPQPH
jgi:hypothetical protein